MDHPPARGIWSYRRRSRLGGETDGSSVRPDLSEDDAPSAGLIPAELHSVSQPPEDRIHGPTAKPFRLPALGCRGASRGYPGKQLHE